MSEVYNLPSPEDKTVVETAVSVFLTSQNGHARQRMLKAARAILDRYSINKLCFGDYVVKADKQPGWSVIVGKKEITGRYCPGCGADIYSWPGDVRVISIKEGFKKDHVSYACRCGNVFTKQESIE
jgi:hypothetical protein